MKPTLLELHWRDGRKQAIPCAFEPMPERVQHSNGREPLATFKLGAQREQFAVIKGRETLCNIARYWEVAT